MGQELAEEPQQLRRVEVEGGCQEQAEMGLEAAVEQQHSQSLAVLKKPAVEEGEAVVAQSATRLATTQNNYMAPKMKN